MPLFEVGFVAKAHGIRGEVAVRTFDPGSTALLDVPSLLLTRRDGRQTRHAIRGCRPANGPFLVSLEGIGSRTEAEALVGAKVSVDREALPPPEEGEFFQGDLVGLTAVDEGGTEWGTVAEVWNTGPVPNLVIQSGEQEWLVPFADEFVREVDLPARRLIVRKPELIE